MAKQSWDPDMSMKSCDCGPFGFATRGQSSDNRSIWVLAFVCSLCFCFSSRGSWSRRRRSLASLPVQDLGTCNDHCMHTGKYNNTNPCACQLHQGAPAIKEWIPSCCFCGCKQSTSLGDWSATWAYMHLHYTNDPIFMVHNTAYLEVGVNLLK